MGEWFECVARKIWILLRVFLLLILFSFPDILAEKLHASQGGLLVIGILTLLLAAFYWWRAEKNTLKVWDKQFFTWKGLAIVIGGYVVCYLGGVIGHYVMELEGNSITANQEELMAFFELVPTWFIVLTSTVLPAVAEEVLIRGYILKLFFGRYQLAGLLLSSLLFALLHGPTNIGSWIVYTSPGLVLGYVYAKTDYLIYPIAIHFLNNTVISLLYVSGF